MEVSMKHSKVNLGQIEAVVNRLGGMEGLKRYLSLNWRIWGRVGCSQGVKTPEDFIAFAKGVGVEEFTPRTEAVIRKMVFSLNDNQLDLVLTTADDITGQRSSPNQGEDTVDMAHALGLTEIPHSYVPDILARIVCLKKSGSRRASFYIGMSPVFEADGKKNYLSVMIGDEASNGKLVLCAGQGDTASSFAYPNYNNWIFARYRGWPLARDQSVQPTPGFALRIRGFFFFFSPFINRLSCAWSSDFILQGKSWILIHFFFMEVAAAPFIRFLYDSLKSGDKYSLNLWLN